MEKLAPTGDINELPGEPMTSLTIQLSKPTSEGETHYDQYKLLASQDPDT